MKINKILIVVLAVVVASSLTVGGVMASKLPSDSSPVTEASPTVSAATELTDETAEVDMKPEEPGNQGVFTEVNRIVYDSFAPPVDYNPPVRYPDMIMEKDVMIPMRDGVKVNADVYRPDTTDKVPAILSMAGHYKELQTPEFEAVIESQPAWSTLWMGACEAGDTEYLVTRGYAHILANPRNCGKSEDGPNSAFDYYDVIEWIAAQPWCDGQVGMLGLSAFGGAQFSAAYTQPPHLKAIFAMDPGGKYPQDGTPGGVQHFFSYLLSLVSCRHGGAVEAPGPLPPAQEALWEEAIQNPDYAQYGQLWNILMMKGQWMPRMFSRLIDPYVAEGAVEAAEANLALIDIPVYTGSGWYAFTYKTHLQGAQSSWAGLVNAPEKKLMFTGPAHMERPFHQYTNEVLRWYDYWFKGIKTGILQEPAVKMWVEGENRWLYADDWPIPETQWTKLYLHSWERLRCEPFPPSTREDTEKPDTFVQMPPTLTNEVASLKYYTDPLPQDVLIAGPISLTLYASIDQEDDNWIVILKDVGPDVSVRTARADEREIPTDLPERELTRGWLKLSDRAVDPDRSTPWKPWHPQTREAAEPVIPGEIYEYNIEIMSVANMFKEGHRICLEITSADYPAGVAGLTDVEYIPYHICSSQTTVHNIYHSEEYPSHLLLPVIPTDAQQWIDSIGK